MRIIERIESAFRRQPLTAEELTSRSEAKNRQEAARKDEAVVKRTGRIKLRLL